MDRRTRIIVFDGGLLEVVDNGDGANDGSAYQELFRSDTGDGVRALGATAPRTEQASSHPADPEVS